MIVDSSAIVAVLQGEDDARLYHDALLAAGRGRMSAGTYVECSLVVDGRRDPVLSHQLDRYLRGMRVQIEPLTVDQARLARQAHREFGRGSGHPAKLNLGDCFAYALAKDADEPLLYKGDDFVHTDVRPAVPR
ncbi:type II toxin-antitoxin system VapC family toxin [Actinomycetospora termitidis]|uniref:Ribonuclease VapC n=1 Tax=Actinomycetospora termitidis TaxID=3053470 RepID=A0ABT7M8K8_9PSEU|nr:type II toxin-antitoxin system VapC family toxin [Actinomycetospora sp. Odt1-22]MDL5157014.1 type II toxin-antitoxin system VapC family toxin [Actinomycetospora sp. Odt1-22]